MQRSSRSETLRNALVVSLALAVSYAAPRLASSPESGPRAAASAYGLDLAALERSITADEDDDGARAERRWHAAAAATRAERSHRKALERALEAAARRAAASAAADAAAEAHDAASAADDCDERGDDDDVAPEAKGPRAPGEARWPEERPHLRRR